MEKNKHTTLRTHIVIVLFAVISCFSALSQTPGEWTWVHGSNTSATLVTGTQGIPGDDVLPPAVYEGRTWVDLDGNFWLYSGLHISDFSGTTNYLWKYNPTTNQWTWMKGDQNSFSVSSVLGTQGVADPTNFPGGCDLGNSASWRDLNGDFWLLHSDAILGNCVMWKYELATNNWTWMSGNIPANYGTQGIPSVNNNPEIFYECPVSWVSDEGDLWFFDGYNGGVMWKYEIATGEWTWMSGVEDTGLGTAVEEGTQGVFDAANQPGGSWIYPSWKRDNNTFYMFGPYYILNGDVRSAMWCYDPAINQWAWVGGVQTASTSTFGAPCEFSASNVPSSSLEFTCSWTDECGLFWGYNELDTYLWCYDPNIDQFAIVSGNTTGGDSVFGTLGVSDPGNDPGGVYAPPHWIDQEGNIWRYGATSAGLISSALWRYTPDPNCIAGTGDPSLTNDEESGCAPLTIQFSSPTIDPDAVYAWDFGVIGSTTDVSTDANPTFTFTDPGTYLVQLVVSGDVSSFCCSGDCDTLLVEIEVIAPAILDFDNDTICVGETTTLTVSGANSYSWSPAAGLNTTVGNTVEANPTTTTEYIITGTIGGCSVDDTLTVVVNTLPQVTVNSPTICENSSASLTAAGANTYSWTPSTTLDTNTGSTVQASPASTTTYTVTGTDSNGCTDTAQSTVTVEVVDISVNSGNYCAGDPANPLVLTATGASTYQWSPATGLNTTSGNQVSASPAVNTTYQVIGTSVNNCSDTTEAVVTVIPAFTVTVNSDSICSGNSTLLTALGADTYGWSPPEGLSSTSGSTVTASPQNTQVYTVTGNVSGCNESATATVTVIPVPNAQIEVTPNPVLSSDPVVTFSTPNLEDSVLWYHDAELISQLHEFTQNLDQAFGTYEISLVVTNELGCPDSVSFTVIIQEDVVFWVPTAFTPNSDGVNDVFLPIITSGIDRTTYSLEIFDRWGEVIFSSKNPDQAWTGSVHSGSHFAQDGAYVWLIKFKQEYGAEWHEHTGHVVMVR